jgi:hypothetical protein
MAVLPSPLSNSIQGINESTVSGSVFGGNKPDPETKSTLQSLSSSVASLQNQVNELGKNNIANIGVFTNFQQSFANQIDSVRLQLSKVDQTLESVATIITSESAIESQKNRYEEEKEKRLAEAGARGGKESLLETKIQNALSEPVNRIGNKVSFGFQNLMSFITTLLGGWLTLEGIKAIKAYQDGDKKQLDDIKNSVIKTLAIAGGIFGVINFGIGRVITTIIGLAAKIGKFVVGGLIIKPFQAVMTGIGNAANGIFRGNKPPTPPPKGQKGPNPAGGKFNVIGGFISVVSGTLNFLNGENVDAALNALTILPIGGRFGTGLRVAAGTMVGLDEIAEFLGGNLTGADPKLLKEKKEELKKAQEAEKNKNKLKSSSIKKSEPPKPEAAKPVPTTSMIPPASNLQIKAPETPKSDKPSPTPAPATSAPAPSSTSAPATTSVSAPTPAISSTPASAEASKPAPAISSTPASAEASKPAPAPSSALPLTPTPAETSSKPSTPEITPAQTTKMQTVPFNIGPEPEPKPNIIYTPSGSSSPPPQQPLKSGPASDVPAIPSSNPDNFYTLYSQINYNVVM